MKQDEIAIRLIDLEKRLRYLEIINNIQRDVLESAYNNKKKVKKASNALVDKDIQVTEK